MMTVRKRAIELATQPDFAVAPVAYFPDAGRAKLEADAYLAIGINGLTFTLANSSKNHQKFQASFAQKLCDEYPAAQKNSDIKPDDAFEVFRASFNDAFVDDFAIGDVIYDEPLGGKIRRAAAYYVRAAERLTKKAGVGVSYEDMYAQYRTPAMLLRLGMLTFEETITPILQTINSSKLTVLEREDYLRASSRGLRARSSLSMHQSRLYKSWGPEIKGGQINSIPDIKVARKLPTYSHPTLGSQIRPHRGCPAMPDLSGADVLHAGSGIEHLWGGVSRLIIATNMHVLDSDDPEHFILKDGYQPFNNYQETQHYPERFGILSGLEKVAEIR